MYFGVGLFCFADVGAGIGGSGGENSLQAVLRRGSRGPTGRYTSGPLPNTDWLATWGDSAFWGFSEGDSALLGFSYGDRAFWEFS